MVVKINISMPKDMLEELDRAARESHTSRSAFLAQAVKDYLEKLEEERKKERRRKAADEIDRLRKKFGGWDGTAEILKWRDRH